MFILFNVNQEFFENQKYFNSRKQINSLECAASRRCSGLHDQANFRWLFLSSREFFKVNVNEHFKFASGICRDLTAISCWTNLTTIWCVHASGHEPKIIFQLIQQSNPISPSGTSVYSMWREIIETLGNYFRLLSKFMQKVFLCVS